MTIKPLTFRYKSHRGEISERRVIPDALEFILDPGYDYQTGWFLSGHDLDKNARRSFALCNIQIKTSGLMFKIFRLHIEAETTTQEHET